MGPSLKLSVGRGLGGGDDGRDDRGGGKGRSASTFAHNVTHITHVGPAPRVGVRSTVSVGVIMTTIQVVIAHEAGSSRVLAIAWVLDCVVALQGSPQASEGERCDLATSKGRLSKCGNAVMSGLLTMGILRVHCVTQVRRLPAQEGELQEREAVAQAAYAASGKDSDEAMAKCRASPAGARPASTRHPLSPQNQAAGLGNEESICIGIMWEDADDCEAAEKPNHRGNVRFTQTPEDDAIGAFGIGCSHVGLVLVADARSHTKAGTKTGEVSGTAE